MPAKARGLDLDGEMAFAAAVVAGMAAMLRAVVDHGELRRSERFAQAFLDFGGDRAGESSGHCAYIEGSHRKGSQVGERGQDAARFHGRVEGRAQPCAHPGCEAPGEFRAPGARRPGFDGPGDWRWLCLDHVREFNAATIISTA